MPTLAELDVIIKVARAQFKRDLKIATSDLKDAQKRMQKQLDKTNAKKAAKKIKKDVKGIQKSLSGLNFKTFIVGAFGIEAARRALTGLGKSFVTAASVTEQYQVRLNALLGSQEEGNKLFREMATLAGKVPQTFEEIMGAATQLSGVMQGGVEQVKRWMPLILDLAAVTGLGVQVTTGQVIRMFSAGAQSADLFRERGILAMLGFKAGVSFTAEETRKKMFEAWNKADSQFRGATDDLAKTWTGTLSMMSDKWFKFRNLIMESGPFDTLKKLFQGMDKEFGKTIDSMVAKAEIAKDIDLLQQRGISPGRPETFLERSSGRVLPTFLSGVDKFVIGVNRFIAAPAVRFGDRIAGPSSGFTAAQLSAARSARTMEASRIEQRRVTEPINRAMGLLDTPEDAFTRRNRATREAAERRQRAFVFQSQRLGSENSFSLLSSRARLGMFGISPGVNINNRLGTQGDPRFRLGQPRDRGYGFTTGGGFASPESEGSKNFLGGSPKDLGRAMTPNVAFENLQFDIADGWSNTLTSMIDGTSDAAVTIENIFKGMAQNVTTAFARALTGKLADLTVERLFRNDTFLGALLENDSRGGNVQGSPRPTF